MSAAFFFPIFLMAVAVAVLFLIPSREVTQSPEKGYIVWEIVLPGISPQWRYLGGLVLLAWAYFLVQDLFIVWKGSPYIISALAIPNLESAYGVPIQDPYHDALRLINPSWVWVYLAPAVLFAVNLFLVLRARKVR